MESEVENLIRNMQPRVESRPFVFCQLGNEIWRNLSVDPICLFREDEGWTVILEEAQAKKEGLTYEGVWAHIVLQVYSDLSAVGFLAKVTASLAEKGIPVNPVSAFHHDHLFVPWEMRDLAIDVLAKLQNS